MTGGYNSRRGGGSGGGERVRARRAEYATTREEKWCVRRSTREGAQRVNVGAEMMLAMKVIVI